MATIQQFDFSVDLLKAIIWQYNNAAKLQKLLQSKQDWYDTNQEKFWSDWVTDVFDLRTANDFGCNVWAIILGVSTTLLFPPVANAKQPFGFDTTNKTNFNSYNFTSNVTTPVTFSIEEKRLILRLRYRQLVARGTVPETNKILSDLVEPVYGPAYMLDNLDMTETLVCLFPISYNFRLILENYDIIPRPAAVKLNIISVAHKVFGFGTFNENFDNANFTAN